MIEILKGVDQLNPSLAIGPTLIFLRVGAAISLLPVFGEQVVPVRVKLAITFLISSIIFPFSMEAFNQVDRSFSFITLVGPEVVAGLSIGLLFRCLVFSLQIAGSIAAQSTSLSQVFGGGLGVDPQPAFSSLLVVSGLCLATLLGYHLKVINFFILSYEIFPMSTWPNAGVLAEWGVEKISIFFALGFTLAAPFVISSTIYNLGLGIINRAMPQLMVAFVGAPAISFGGLVILFASSVIILDSWAKVFIETANFSVDFF